MRGAAARSGRSLARLAALLAIALLSGCGMTWKHGTATRPVLTGIDVQGNRHVGDHFLVQSIETQTTKKSPFASAHPFDPDTLDIDLERILRHYRARGFYEARIVGWRLASGSFGRGRATLRIQVDEGKPTILRTVLLQGIEDVPPDDRHFLLHDLPLKEGERLDEGNYDIAKQLLLERLQIRGYAKAEVQGIIRVHPEDRKADVTLAADMGDRYKLGAITVEGNHHTSDRPILWASALHPGMRYSTRLIDAAQTGIYDTGVFNAVSIDPGEPVAGNRLPLIIRVHESKIQSVQWGVGGGLDRTREQVLTRVTYKNRNLFGGLDQLEATARGGYAVIPDLLTRTRTGPIWGANVRFQRPDFFSRGLHLRLETTYDHTVEEPYDADEARGTAGLDETIGQFELGGAYGLELFKLSHIKTASGTVAEPAPEQARPDRCPTPCTISWLEPHLAWDHRDDPIEPRRGWYTSLNVEKGGGALLGGDYDYWKAMPELRVYATPNSFGPAQRWTFAARAMTGWILPSNGPSPVVRRFYAGGPDSMRGYATRRLSPMVHSTTGATLPIGGDNLILGSFETRVWISEKISTVGFVDTGWVDNSRTDLNLMKMAWATGPGVRYLSPIGPIRFDVGWLFHQPAEYTLDSPHDRVREPHFAFHVGLGEAF